MLTHNGYVYSTEVDEDEDVRKIDHYVTTPDGERRPIPFSPYEYMTERSFQTWIEMGLPAARLVAGGRAVVNYTNTMLGVALEISLSKRIPLTDHDAIEDAFWSIAEKVKGSAPK